MAVPEPVQTFVHVYPDANELGRVFTPDLPIVASSASFAEALAGLDVTPVATRSDWRETLRREYLDAATIPSPTMELDPATIIGRVAAPAARRCRDHARCR